VIVVVDAAVVVAALVDNGPTGQWCELQLMAEELAAPHLMPVETANILRRSARVWQLRNNMTAYDAWYIAIAESLNAPLATLDMRLSWASGCTFLTPPDIQAI
jgi:predicted nucleic acid-binding protein